MAVYAVNTIIAVLIMRLFTLHHAITAMQGDITPGDSKSKVVITHALQQAMLQTFQADL